MEKKADLFWLAIIRLHQSAKNRPTKLTTNYSLIYMKSGPMLLEVDGVELTLKAGEYFCLPQGATYSIHHLQNKGVEYYFLRFTLDDPFLAKNLLTLHPPLPVDRSAEIKFDYLIENWNNKDPQNQFICENFLVSLLVLLFVQNIRYHKKDSKFILTEGYSETTQKVFHYIESNFFSQFTLEDMGKTLGYNKSYLSAAFSKDSGLSIMEYANFLRIRTAVVVFLHFSYSVSVAAERVGFNSLSYFSRTFKAFTGVSPSDFLNGVSGMEEAERLVLVNETPFLNGHPCTTEEAFASMRKLGEIAGSAKK